MHLKPFKKNLKNIIVSTKRIALTKSVFYLIILHRELRMQSPRLSTLAVNNTERVTLLDTFILNRLCCAMIIIPNTALVNYVCIKSIETNSIGLFLYIRLSNVVRLYYIICRYLNNRGFSSKRRKRSSTKSITSNNNATVIADHH